MLRVLEKENKWKRTDKPDSVTALACYDGHSSGTRVTVRLKHPTRRHSAGPPAKHRTACLAPAYLGLLQVEIARFTRRTFRYGDSSLLL